ncbi:hypothetical protein, partial [Aeromonas salmonicida]
MANGDVQYLGKGETK